jgi:hypothetical protein
MGIDKETYLKWKHIKPAIKFLAYACRPFLKRGYKPKDAHLKEIKKRIDQFILNDVAIGKTDHVAYLEDLRDLFLWIVDKDTFYNLLFHYVLGIESEKHEKELKERWLRKN